MERLTTAMMYRMSCVQEVRETLLKQDRGDGKKRIKRDTEHFWKEYPVSLLMERLFVTYITQIKRVGLSKSPFSRSIF